MTQVPADVAGSLTVGPTLLAAGATTGALTGLTFVAKDLFDVAGWPTGAGNPDWLAAAVPASQHAVAVQRLLDAGADLIGKAHTDELAFSLTGRNVHYGTPVNWAAPGRLPGGSSSGSAAAVACGLADIGLGSDTGGSVRVPASYCGLLGYRPTHGRVPLDGVVPLAPSFDTAGVLARSGRVLADAMLALLGIRRPPRSPVIARLLVATDALAQLDESCLVPWLRSLARVDLPVSDTVLTRGPAGIAQWRAAFSVIQTAQAWSCKQDWLTTDHPRLSPGVRSRLLSGESTSRAALAEAEAVRRRAAARVARLLSPGAVLALPSACGVAPELTVPDASVDDIRVRTLTLNCVAALAGAPAVSLPLVTVDGLPLGVSLVAAAGQDEALLDMTARLLP